MRNRIFIEKVSVLHIDGKAVKAAAAKSEGQNPVYMLNAMYEGVHLSTKIDDYQIQHDKYALY